MDKKKIVLYAGIGIAGLIAMKSMGGQSDGFTSGGAGAGGSPEGENIISFPDIPAPIINIIGGDGEPFIPNIPEPKKVGDTGGTSPYKLIPTVQETIEGYTEGLKSRDTFFANILAGGDKEDKENKPKKDFVQTTADRGDKILTGYKPGLIGSIIVAGAHKYRSHYLRQKAQRAEMFKKVTSSRKGAIWSTATGVVKDYNLVYNIKN